VNAALASAAGQGARAVGCAAGGQRRALRVAGVVALGLAALLVPFRGSGQLLSPGPLAGAHAELEGLRNCTACHELGRKGASDARCRSCHTLIDTRIKAGRGYHASVEGQTCASCHKEHQGRDFDVLRLDTARFDHGEIGYALEGGHSDSRCRDCHRTDRIKAPDVLAWARQHGNSGRTLLGLGRSCRGCHGEDDAHGAQFRGRECETCHATSTWTEAVRFDHDRAGYRLTGGHRQARCEGCHPMEGAGETATVKYTGVPVGTCAGCHEDYHKGGMGGDCASCHDTRGWAALNRSAMASRFDHARTKFPLGGKHADAECAACHARPRRRNDPVHIRIVAGTEASSFPQPRAGACTECHVDGHAGELTDRSDGGACQVCHGEDGWTPAGFGIERHNAETAFALNGAHVVAFCSGCHAPAPAGRTALTFAVAARDCAACHRQKDPHSGRFGARPCESCHITDSFRTTRFAHDSVGGARCRTCHEPDDPHAGQFHDARCESCHGTVSWATLAFDHQRARFPLDGQHANVACALCHTPEAASGGALFVRYRPLRTECSACHGSVS
jgi:hypothetical protein